MKVPGHASLPWVVWGYPHCRMQTTSLLLRHPASRDQRS